MIPRPRSFVTPSLGVRLSQAEPLVPVVFGLLCEWWQRCRSSFPCSFRGPVCWSMAGSPTWTFSDSFSVVRLSSVLDRGLTTARLEVSSGFRYNSFDIKLPTFCGSNALFNDGGLLREGIEKKRRLRRSGDDYDHELLGR